MATHRHRWLPVLLVLTLLASFAAGAAPRPAAAVSSSKLPSVDSVLQRIKTQVIVRFKDDVTPARAASEIAASGGVIKKSLAFHNTRLASYSGTASAQAALKKLNADPRVVYAFYNQRLSLPKDQSNPSALVNRVRRAAQLPGSKAGPFDGARDAGTFRQAAVATDPLRTNQWALDRIGDDLTPAPRASAPVVAVIDTGMDYTHPDLAANYQRCPQVPGLPCDLVGFDQDPMDENGHGTHVAGLIAARDDGMGIVGVSPHSKVLPVRVLDASGFTDTMTLFQGIDYAMQAKVQIPNLRVANLSIGGFFLAGSVEHQEMNSRLRALRTAGVLPVVAAGNDSDFLIQAYPLVLGIELVELPAMSPSAFAVAATDHNDYRTFFSNYSTNIKVNSCKNRIVFNEGDYVCKANNTYTVKHRPFARIAAPGWLVLSTVLRGQYIEFAGTSMSSPMVAGAAARVMSANPGLTNGGVQQRLIDTGLPLGVAKGFPMGARRLDLRRALGVGGTGFTGRVVDGVSGRPLGGARVTMTGGGAALSTTTNSAGFYTLKGARGAVSYSLRASKASPAYISNANTATALSGRFIDPHDISLAPARTDGAYTMMLEWKNAFTGIDEFFRQELFTEPGPCGPNGCVPGRRYPWPVNGNRQPFAILDSYFGAPIPGQLSDSVDFAYFNPGSMTAFPYGRLMGDWGFELSPHEGVVIRQRPAVGSMRYGIKWLSPTGVSNPGARVTVYRNSTLLRRSELASSAAPTDGTPGLGRSLFNPSTWGVYYISSNGTLGSPTANRNGQRSDYGNWILRNNDIQGVPGPARGNSVSARLDASFDGSGAFAGDFSDVYRVGLVAGKTYAFKLRGPAGSDFDLVLFGPKSLSIFDFSKQPVAFSTQFNTSNETMKYAVPAGKGGKYYVLVAGFQGSGTYVLSRP